MTLLQPGQEIVERDIECIGSQCLGSLQQARAPLNSAEVPNIVVNQQTSVEFENRARVGSGFCVEQQLAGHPEMNRKYACIQLEHDELAVAANRLYELIAQAPAERWEFLSNHVTRKEPSVDYAASGELGRQGSNDGFHFG